MGDRAGDARCMDGDQDEHIPKIESTDSKKGEGADLELATDSWWVGMYGMHVDTHEC